MNPSPNYKVTVTTRNAANAIIHGPSQSTAYTAKQIGANAITDGAMTSSKPAESFMKRVTLEDDEVGHVQGWNLDGVDESLTIQDPDLVNVDSSFVRL